MITKELIARINELSRKKRSSGLSEDERIEQQALRREYLAGIREQVSQRCLPLATRKLQISTARSDERAGVLGAAQLVIDERLQSVGK